MSDKIDPLLEEILRLRKENESLKKSIKISVSKEDTGICLYGFRGGRSCFMNWNELDYMCSHIDEFKKHLRK